MIGELHEARAHLVPFNLEVIGRQRQKLPRTREVQLGRQIQTLTVGSPPRLDSGSPDSRSHRHDSGGVLQGLPRSRSPGLDH